MRSSKESADRARLIKLTQEVLINLETLSEQQARNAAIHEPLRHQVGLLRGESANIRHLKSANGPVGNSVRLQLEILHGDIDRAREGLLHKKSWRIWSRLWRKKKKKGESLPETDDQVEAIQGPLKGIVKAVNGLQHLTKTYNIGHRASRETLNSADDEKREALYRTFHDFLAKQSEVENIAHRAINLLNTELPNPDWAGAHLLTNDDIAGGTTDSMVYSQAKIDRAKLVASQFHFAWDDVFSKRAEIHCCLPDLDVVTNLAMVCLVLKTMNRENDLLGEFYTYHQSKRHKLNLPLELDVLSEILPDLPGMTRRFKSEQYRVVRRDFYQEWDLHRSPIILAAEEPLPFYRIRDCKGGSFAKVSIWCHVDMVQDSYAIKEAHDPKDKTQLKKEMENLKRIREHTHVIRLVFALERLDSLMLVLKPAAQFNLLELVQSYQGYLNNPQQEIDLGALRKVFLSAFGCLSHGLLHLHADIRHKDIKLDNILYVKENEVHATARLVITDFGSAHYYGSGNDSRTNHLWRYNSWKCTAPEVLKDDPLYKETRLSRLQHGLGSKAERNTLEVPTVPHQAIEPSISQPHDTKSDIFSLGACFMQILSALGRDSLPGGSKIHIVEPGSENPDTDQQNTNKPDADTLDTSKSDSDMFIFAENVDTVCAWAKKHEEAQVDPYLKAALHVSRHMIQFHSSNRWSLQKVIKHVAGHDGSEQQGFCTERCRTDALNLAETTVTNSAIEDTRQVPQPSTSETEGDSSLQIETIHVQATTAFHPRNALDQINAAANPLSRSMSDQTAIKQNLHNTEGPKSHESSPNGHGNHDASRGSHRFLNILRRKPGSPWKDSPKSPGDSKWSSW